MSQHPLLGATWLVTIRVSVKGAKEGVGAEKAR